MTDEIILEMYETITAECIDDPEELIEWIQPLIEEVMRLRGIPIPKTE